MRTEARKRRPRAAERANLGEFFFTQMGAVERTPEFVRLTFFSDRQTVSLALTPSLFHAMAGVIAMLPDGVLN